MQVNNRRLVGGASELLVAYRFMVAGRVPSWPLIPCAYDLIIDCGNVLQRVQVKTGHAVDSGNVWRVRLTKRNGVKGDQPAFVAAVDYVVVLCDPNTIYVIPSMALRSPSNPETLVPQLQIYRGNERFQNCLNHFAIGEGCGVVASEQATVRSAWRPTAPPPNSRRRKQRYSIEDIARIRQELGSNPTSAEIEAMALRLNITGATVRNYLRGYRSDLRPLAETDTLPHAATEVAPPTDTSDESS